MSHMWFTRRRMMALAAVAGLSLIAAAACGGDEAAVATQAPQATKAPAVAATAKPAAPAATVAPGQAAPTATAVVAQATATKAPDVMVKGPSGKVVWAVRDSGTIYGVPFVGPYRGSAGGDLGIREFLFWYQNGDPMAPQLAEGWSISADGTAATVKIRKGIPWNAPVDSPGLVLGDIDALDVVWWINTGNSTTNPGSTYPDAGDFASVFLEAKATDKYTVVIPFVSPIYTGLPLSAFGLHGAAEGPRSQKAFDRMGLKWANDHEIGTGSMVQGECVAAERCSSVAVTSHWRHVAGIAELQKLQVPEPTTRVAMLKNGSADMSEMDFKLVPDIIKDTASGIRYIQTMPGGYVGQSIIWAGNLWEEFHARTGAALNPWDSPVYAEDYAWIGNPWGDASTGKCAVSATCKPAKYTESNNPAGMDDMEQARLVRLALSMGMDREGINKVILGGLGTPIYSEYTGPEYPGWDPKRWTGVWDWNSRTPKTAPAANVGVPWLTPFDSAAGEKLLDQAGYTKKADGTRFSITLQAYAAEAGEVGLTVADAVTSQWTKMGVKIDQLREDYGGVISPRMRQRIQFLPILKNGDVHSNVWPLDLPPPPVDSSISRPGFGVGFEPKPVAEWNFAINAEKDKTKREAMHIAATDYVLFWQLYSGIFQVPKGIAIGKTIKGWSVPSQQHYHNLSSFVDYIERN